MTVARRNGARRAPLQKSGQEHCDLMRPSFEFVPQKLVYGGDALGYHDGHAVMVPRVLPGERVDVEAVRTVKGVIRARPLRILAGARERVAPPCPYFGRCGGCQYQHISPGHQTTWKIEILRETLRRIGKIHWPDEIVLYAGPPWNYRNQAQLKIARHPNGQVAVGFYEAESHRICDVESCMILSPRLNMILGELRRAEWSERLAACKEVELLADDQDDEVILKLRASAGSVLDESLANDCLTRLPGVAGVAIERGRELRLFGKTKLTYKAADFSYQISPGSFFQASRFLLPRLVTTVTGDESSLPVATVTERRHLALDLFAGVGLFTLPLAQRFAQVIGVEANPKAAADLAANAESHGFDNVRAVTETAFDFIRRFARPEPDLVVLDPPRSGVGVGALKPLVELRPKRIHYASCSPPTLARDLGLLVDRGYRLNSVELFDFFPQTSHIECLAKLTPIDLANS